MRTLFTLATLALCTLAAAPQAQAKKSRISVHICEGALKNKSKKVGVWVYDGDDGVRGTARKKFFLDAGQTRRTRCKVKSGKKRCWVGVRRTNGNTSELDQAFDSHYTIRVKDGRTLYISEFRASGANQQVRYSRTSCSDAGRWTYEG